MIDQDTAGKIWECYREIQAAEKLLADMAKDIDQDFSGGRCYEPTLKDAFGRRRQLQLGVPCGDSSHSLYKVSWSLGETIVRAHIEEKRAELKALGELARLQLALTRLESDNAKGT